MPGWWTIVDDGRRRFRKNTSSSVCLDFYVRIALLGILWMHMMICARSTAVCMYLNPNGSSHNKKSMHLILHN